MLFQMAFVPTNIPDERFPRVSHIRGYRLKLSIPSCRGVFNAPLALLERCPQTLLVNLTVALPTTLSRLYDCSITSVVDG